MNIMPVDGPRMLVRAATGSDPFDATSRSYDQAAWRFGSLMNTRLCSVSTATLCRLGYGSATTRVGGTSPPAIVDAFQSGHCPCAAIGSSPVQPFSRSSASRDDSEIGDRVIG